MSGRAARLLALVLGVALAAPAAAAAAARAEILVPGRWLRGAAGPEGAWLLVAASPEAPRQLLGLRWRDAAARSVAQGLPAELTGILPVPATAGGGLLLVARGQAFAVDQGSGAVTPLAGAGELIGGGAGAFTIAPPWLADARLGTARAVRLAGGSLAATATQALPIAAERESWGLRLSSPPLSFAGSWLVVGPRQEGRRVRTLLLGPAGERVEHVGLLPEPEQVADHAVVLAGGRPLLVLGTFRGLGIASKKRLRVFALDGRGGDAGSPPLLARELPARVWHPVTARAADLDGDGHDDLAIATGEGLSGDGVTFTVFPGRADGRLAAQPVSAGVALPKGATWRYGDVTGDGKPDLLALAGGTLSVHAAGGPTGLPAKRATATQPLGSAERPPRDQVQVTVGSGGSRVERQSERDGESAAPAEAAPAPEDADDEGEDEDEPAGAAGFELVDLDGDGVLEVLRWEPAPEGRTRLSVIGLNSAPG